MKYTTVKSKMTPSSEECVQCEPSVNDSWVTTGSHVLVHYPLVRKLVFHSMHHSIPDVGGCFANLGQLGGEAIENYSRGPGFGDITKHLLINVFV